MTVNVSDKASPHSNLRFNINGSMNGSDKNENEKGHSDVSGKEKDYIKNERTIPTFMKMERRQSKPLMPAYVVSAPGKVIVFGEHAVVHGKVICRLCDHD